MQKQTYCTGCNPFSMALAELSRGVSGLGAMNISVLKMILSLGKCLEASSPFTWAHSSFFYSDSSQSRFPDRDNFTWKGDSVKGHPESSGIHPSEILTLLTTQLSFNCSWRTKKFHIPPLFNSINSLLWTFHKNIRKVPNFTTGCSNVNPKWRLKASVHNCQVQEQCRTWDIHLSGHSALAALACLLENPDKHSSFPI